MWKINEHFCTRWMFTDNIFPIAASRYSTWRAFGPSHRFCQQHHSLHQPKSASQEEKNQASKIYFFRLSILCFFFFYFASFSGKQTLEDAICFFFGPQTTRNKTFLYVTVDTYCDVFYTVVVCKLPNINFSSEMD